jgi:hypothetical protein
MNTTLRNLTLSAAALAALTVTAPNASADDHGRGRREAPRQEARGPERRESPRQEFRERGDRGHGRVVVAPARPFVRYGAGYGYRAPFRVFSGFRFYTAFPGPGYVYIADYGWVLPPFFGAVWVPGHYDIGGAWVEGFWQ